MANSNSFLTSYYSKNKSTASSSKTTGSNSSNSFLSSYFASKSASTSSTTLNAGSSSNSFLSSYLNKDTTVTEESKTQNTNGFLGGLGYLGEKIGLGFLQSIEGIWDYAASGIAKLFGQDDWAEEQVATDWVNYNHADEWFNPSSGWQVAGDVASGIGTSLPAIGAVAAATVISGGTLTATAATLVSSSIAGLSAAGGSLREAYQETGELGGKEYAYATASGVLEGVVEGFEDITGFGSGTVIDNITKTFSKRAAGTLAREGIVKTLVKSFVGEALEEGIEGLVDPYIKRMTIDPDAEDATLSEVGYSALIGGLSGMLMGGFSAGVSTAVNTARGNNIVTNGKTNNVLDTAKAITSYEAENQTGYGSFGTVQSLYNELQESTQKTGGQISTLKQKMLLGQLERANTASAFEPMIVSSAQQIYANADTVAERMNNYYKDLDGNPISITADELRAGIDTTNEKTLRTTLSKALKTNSKLRGIALVDATGRLTMDTKAFADATLRGEALFNQTDLNRFIETANDQELNAVGTQLGVENWSTITDAELKNKIIDFAKNGGIDTYKTENATVKQLISQAEATTEAKKNLPRRINLQNDGVYRYTTDGGVDIAITKQGDSYRVYDYTDKRLSKSLTKQELNKVLQTVRTEQEVRIQEQQTIVKAQEQARNELQQQENERQRAAKELDEYARENVKGYNKLSAANQSMIRSILRQGRLAGVEESTLKSIANVSVHSGLNVLFSKEMSFVAANGTYADGAVDLRNNRIIINPEAKTRTHEMVLIHELTHVIYNLKDGTLQVAEGLKAMSAEEKENIRKRYSKAGQTSSIIIADEINAHFAEQTLSNKNILERLVADKPTVKERILNFFKGAKSDYDGDVKLSKAAERLYKQYKKLFDDFSASNYQNNAVDTTRALKVDESGKVTFMDEKGQTAQTEAEDSTRYAFAGENSETADMSMLEKAKEMTKTVSDMEKIRKETGWFIGYDGKWRYEIDDSKLTLVEPITFETHTTQDSDSYKTAKLGDIIQHDELFAAYPFLKDTTIIIQKTAAQTFGTAFTKDNQIVMSDVLFERKSKAYEEFLATKQTEIDQIEATDEYKEYWRFMEDKTLQEVLTPEEWLEQEKAAEEKFFNSELGKRYYKLMWGTKYSGVKNEFGWTERAKSVLTHEVQHLIQSKEGFASGSSDSYWYNRKLKQYKDAALTEKGKLYELLESLTKEDKDFKNAIYEMEETFTKFYTSQSARNKAYDNAAHYAKTDEQSDILWDYADAYDHLIDFYNDGKREASRMYENTAGEIEARDAENRVNLTAEERRQTKPDYTRNPKSVYFTEKSDTQLDQENKKPYNKKNAKKKTPYSQYHTEAMRWAYTRGRQNGDLKVLHDDYDNINLLIADDSYDEGYGILKSVKDIPENQELIQSLYDEEAKNEDNRTEQRKGDVVYKDIEGYENTSGNNDGNYSLSTERTADGRIGEVYQEQYQRNRNGTTQENSGTNRTVDTTRYALPEDTDDTKKPKYTLSAGQIKKILADYTQERSYTKAQAESIINSVLSSDLFEFGERYGDMSKKSKAQVINTLWQSLNTTKTQTELEQVINDTADYIIQNIALESLYADESNETYTATIEALKPYLHGLNLNSLKDEIKNKYDKNNNAVYALWSSGKNKGIGVDVLQQELAEIGFRVEGDTTAEILFNVVDAYSNAVQHLQKQSADMLSTSMTSAELKNLQFDTAVSLFKEICKTGNETTFARLPNKSDIKALSNLAQSLFNENTQAQKQIDALNAEIKELTKETTRLNREATEAKKDNNILREQLKRREVKELEARKKALQTQLEEQQAKLQAALDKQEQAFKKRLQNVTDKYKKEAREWKNRYYDSRAYNSETNKVLYKTKKLRNVVIGESLNATQFNGNSFKNSIGQLARIEYRGDFNTSGTRKAFSALAAWYTSDNPVLMTNSEDGSSAYYNAEVAAMLKAVAANEKPLTDAQSEKISALMEQSGAKTYQELRDWYTVKNLKSKYNAETKELIRELANPAKFTVEELKQINNLVSYFTHFIETYNRIYRNGQLVDALPVAQENIRIIKENSGIKEQIGLPSRLINKMFNHQKDANGRGLGSYMDTFADPMTVARNHDYYQNGFYTQTMTEFREAMVGTTITEMQMRADIETFYDEHKQWYKELSKRTIEYNGTNLSVTQAMTMYLTLKRQQAQAGLAVSGFKFINEDGTTTRIGGFASTIDLSQITPDELNDMAVTQQEKLYNSLTETDRQFLSVVEDMFNNKDNEYSSKALKYKTDMKLNGYSNVLEDYYFPIYRAFISKTVDSSLYQGEIDRVSNLGFNKNTVTGAKGELYIEPVTRIIDTHIKGIAMYANMATTIRDYDILFNLDIGGNPNKTVSLRSETENDWRNADKYFKKLLSDMQGISPVRGGSGIMGKMRSNYAKSVLGLNPKVWVTQLSSVFAATSRLDYSSIAQGATIIASQTSDLDEYCLIAKARNTENTAALAQGVIETTGKIGDVLMKPIGAMDRFVVRWNYAAAQIQVEKEQGLKVGTKENKIAAGKLTQELILETQQNAMATERSAAMRSGSELMKSLTMFSSDAMKVVGRVIDAFGERSVLKARIKNTTDVKIKTELETRLKEVNKSLRKSLGALTTSAIFMALVAQAFRSLYNKDKDIEDDEDYGLQVLKTMGLDALGNLVGGLPILKDLYSYLVDGYDIEDYSYSTINDLLSSVGDLVDLAEDLFSGSLTSREVAKDIKTVLFNLGKVVGLPVRQTYNLFYGLTSRISESTAYKIDDLFAQQSYVSDLAEAIEKDDTTMISTIMELLLSERTDANLSDTAMSKLTELYKAGYTSILPKSISSSITYNGETLSLTNAQLKTFENTYFAVNDIIETMIDSTTFNSLSEEQQAKAIKLLYDAYYYKALSELTEEDNNTTVGTLSGYLSAEKAAMAYAVVATATSETDEDGNTISGSKKASIIAALQKQGLSDGEILFILCYSAGYTIQDGDYKGYTAKRAKRLLLNYILKLNVTQAEKAAIAAECGFTVKNNRIITSDL